MLLLPSMTFGKTSPRGRVVFALAVSFLGLLGTGIGCGGNNDPRPATWAYVSTAILEPSCATANCHSAIAQRASVDLSTRAAGYKSLVGREYVISKELGDALIPPITTPEERLERSSVPKLMRAVGNLRMPPDLPLPEPDIVLFENWILAGAVND